ncbi:STAS/SEC14 domain-containing protein [Nitratifractor salsuginis]|uniref:STAS/SEC14 domain-containing protein n=1 Tax=Nitratifractor salsuginis (strain DSM 16511 / JCM 12458 / E9I37-1) TaxID=749222 RepID=E6WYT5_NITSE|nr:STAS/SEC14 domain-containing protein [Nitratifractor salsuginis]ADV46521.1 hypothetical protein Nitsa_1268 [Nitratifractor salsuginis DSM 16511]
MSIEIDTRGVNITIKADGKHEYVEIRMQGKLHHRDYQVMIPVMEHAIEAARDKELDILVDMRQFEGWSFEAALDDMKFGLKLRNAFKKMAIVGDKKWEELSIELFKHFSKGEIRFFSDYNEALEWLRSDS